MRALPLRLLLVAAFVFLYTLPQHRDWAWPVAYVALVPLLALQLAVGARASLALGVLGWSATLIAIVFWLRTFGLAAWLGAPPLYVVPFFFLGPALARVRAAYRLPLALLVPVLFTAGEWLRIKISPGQLALGMLGYSQAANTRLLQVADLAGVYGVTFLVAAWNGWFTEIALLLREGAPRLRAARRSLLAQSGALVAATLVVLAYGAARDTESHFRSGPRVAVVQPNLPHYPADREAENRRSYDLQVIYTLSKVPRGAADLILWPENALLDLLEERGRVAARYASDLELLTRRTGAALVLDAAELPEGSDGWTHHTVFHVGRDGRVAGRSRKVYLLPWTEYVPGADALDWLFLGAPVRRLVTGVVGFVPYGRPGRLAEMEVFSADWEGGKTRFGVPICFEAAAPAATRQLLLGGAEFLVNVASEGLLGPSVYRQTLLINAFRAIEGRVPVVRATNTGISAFVDANGRVRSLLRGAETGALYNDRGVLIDRVPLDARTGTTLYVRAGDAFAHATLLASVLLLVAAELRLRRRAAPAEVAAG